MKIRLSFLILAILFLPFLISSQSLYTLPTVRLSVIFARLGNVLYYILVLLAFIFVLWGAIAIATAGGDPDKVAMGKRMIMYALIGIIVGSVAYALVSLMVGYVAR